MPSAHASAPICQIQIIGVDYASTVEPGKTLDVKTNVKVTCVPVNQNVLVRVDLLSADTNKTVSTNSQGIGTIEVSNAPYFKIINVTILNSVQTPSAASNWGLQLLAWVFVGPDVSGIAKQMILVHVGSLPQSTSSRITSESTQTTSSASAPLSIGALGPIGLVGLVVAVGVVASAVVLMRRRKPHEPQATVVEEKVMKGETKPEAPRSTAIPRGENISTGYDELDKVLVGGLPAGYAILIVSPPCDEKDLLFRKIIESGLSIGNVVLFLSRDLGRTQDFATRYRSNFYAFTPQADKIATDSGNVFKISGVQNLNDLNISFAKAIETLPLANKDKIIMVDLLSDVLLDHKALTTRKWLDDFVGKRKAEGFTVLATLNPLISSKQESQTIIDLFDGIIEIYEKELRERARRFLIVKKMYGRKYIETELMLDKDKLF